MKINHYVIFLSDIERERFFDSPCVELLKRRGRTFRIGRDVRVFLIFLGGIANQTLIALSAIAILMNVENIRRVFLCYVRRDVAFS